MRGTTGRSNGRCSGHVQEHVNPYLKPKHRGGRKARAADSPAGDLPRAIDPLTNATEDSSMNDRITASQ